VGYTVKSKAKFSSACSFAPTLHTNLFARFSLVLLGLLLSLPFLIPVHRMPIPSFYSEWLAVFLGCLASLFFLWALIAQAKKPKFIQIPIQIPYIASLPVALFLIVLAQAILGYFAYINNALVVMLFLLWSALLMIVTSNCLRLFAPAQLIQKLALFVLVGGVINAIFGLLQFFQIAQYLPNLITEAMSLTHSGVYGNLAQQNHFATHLSLAAAALLYLYGSQCLSWLPSIVLASLLTLGLFLSGSRSAFLYLICCLFFYYFRRPGNACYLCSLPRLFRTKYIALLPVMVLGLAILLGFIVELPQLKRYLYLSEAVGARAFLWGHAWQMFTDAPVLGVGWDAFAYRLIEQIGQSGKINVWGIDQYAHNLPLQLLAVSGMTGFLALVLPVGFFLRRQFQQSLNHERRFFYTCLSILLIHSLLEQPLYYAYFLAIASCIFACAESKSRLVILNKFTWGLSIVVIVAALVTSVKTFRDFAYIENNFYGENAPISQQTPDQIRSNHTWSIFPSLIESMRPDVFVSHQASPSEKLILNQRLMHYAPVAETEFRHAALLAEVGNISEARRRFFTAALAYPEATDLYLARCKLLAKSEPQKYAALVAYAETFTADLHAVRQRQAKNAQSK